MKWNIIWKAMVVTSFILGITEIGESDKAIMVMIFATAMYIFNII